MLNQLDELLALLSGHRDSRQAVDAQSIPSPDTAGLAAKIAAQHLPHTHPETGQLLSQRVHDHARQVANRINSSGQVEQIRYLLDNGDTEADIRAHLKA